MSALSPQKSTLVPQANTPMMRQFNAIKQQHQDKILFFRMGDFYEMFGEDAIQAAKVLQIALTARGKNTSTEPIPMCGVPYHAYEQYLNKLTTAGYTVAICEQMQDPTQAKGIVEREVTRIVTPGTTVSPQLISPDRNHYLFSMSLHLQKRRIGIALVDVSTGEFEVTEFALSEIQKLYDFIYQTSPQEVLLPQSRSEAESSFLEKIMQEIEKLLRIDPKTLSPTITFIDPYSFDHAVATQQLNQHFQTLNLAGFGLDQLPYGTAAAGAILQYLKETQKCDLSHITHIKQHSFEEFMLLDETTISNLELFHSHSGEIRHTLYGILNQTQTAMGARMLRRWIQQPLLDLESIEQRHQSVTELSQNLIFCEEPRHQLAQIQDLPRIAGRISLPIAGVNDLLGLRESLLPLQELPNWFSHFTSLFLVEIMESFDPLEDVLTYLQTHLLEEPAKKLKEGGFIAHGISEELDRLRELTKDTKNILNQMIEKEREATGISSLKIKYNKVFGYYLEVSNAYKNSVPPHYIRKQTLVNAARFVTPELNELEEEILGAEERMNELEYTLFQEIKNQIIQHIPRIQNTATMIAKIDVISSFAYLAETQNYICPQMHRLESPPQLEIKGGRHPVIEQIDFEEPFVSNDVLLNEDHQQIMLITGPNMAGKSTYMRQVALCVLMAQCGSFLPAESATLSIVDRVFTRVGASDNLSRGQSTFMVEMNEAASILNHATERSLIILDEIGRGTSTYDGISLAWSIVEYIHHLGALTLCATHYHELTQLSSMKRVQNFNVLVKEDGEKIVFVRKIVAGEADKSYGIQVARLAGLPKSIIERAMVIMTSLEETSSTPNLQLAHEEEVKEEEVLTQLSFFEEESPYLQELKQVDINHMTPMKALTYLDDLVFRIKSETKNSHT